MILRSGNDIVHVLACVDIHHTIDSWALQPQSSIYRHEKKVSESLCICSPNSFDGDFSLIDPPCTTRIVWKQFLINMWSHTLSFVVKDEDCLWKTFLHCFPRRMKTRGHQGKQIWWSETRSLSTTDKRTEPQQPRSRVPKSVHDSIRM